VWRSFNSIRGLTWPTNHKRRRPVSERWLVWVNDVTGKFSAMRRWCWWLDAWRRTRGTWNDVIREITPTQQCLHLTWVTHSFCHTSAHSVTGVALRHTCGPWANLVWGQSFSPCAPLLSPSFRKANVFQAILKIWDCRKRVSAHCWWPKCH